MSEFQVQNEEGIVYSLPGLPMKYVTDIGSTERRGLHPDGQRVQRVPLRPAEASSVHDLWQEAALHRGKSLYSAIYVYIFGPLSIRKHVVKIDFWPFVNTEIFHRKFVCRISSKLPSL